MYASIIQDWKTQGVQRVLVCPLNWGLGHASRCIPIIHTLLDQGIIADIASDGRALDFLKQEFPELRFFNLPSYRIQYRYKNILLNLLRALPAMLFALWQTPRILRQYAKEHPWDVIISDNRLACRISGGYNIFISHQLRFQGAPGFMTRSGDAVHRYFIRKYDACWVPDYAENERRLSGGLADAKGLKNVVYIGPLSRFEKSDMPVVSDILVVLSGPEPQRTVLEGLLTKSLQKTQWRIELVRGIPGKDVPEMVFPSHFTVHNFMRADALNKAILANRLILTRSGYSTIMDLYALDRHAILIPTPGQIEQEYLADYHRNSGRFEVLRQREIEVGLIPLIEMMLD